MLRLLRKPIRVFFAVLIIIPALLTSVDRFALLILAAFAIYTLYRLGSMLYYRRRRW